MMLILVFGFFLRGAQSPGQCLPAEKIVPLEPREYGSYARFHPSGRYMMLSGVEARGEIYDLESRPVRQIVTPLQNEVYPVEGSWTLLASPLHLQEDQKHSMKYFSLQKVLQSPNAEPEFSDFEHDEYYHSSAEFADSTPRQLHFRTVLYESLKYRDYKVSWSKDGKAQVEKSEVKPLCPRIIEDDDVPLSESEQTRIDSRIAVLEAERLKWAKEILEAGSSNRQALAIQIGQTEAELVALLKRAGRLISLYGELSQPIVSKDGKYIAALVDDSNTVLYKIEKDGCRVVGETGFYTPKVSFAYPEGEALPRIAFVLSGRVQVYDFEKKQIWPISREKFHIARYPGFLNDGRVAYLYCDSGECGVTITDPYQVPGAPSGPCATASAASTKSKAGKK